MLGWQLCANESAITYSTILTFRKVTMNSSGIFNVAELNSIRDAHIAWCTENSVDPKSPRGQEAVAYLLKAFGSECQSVDDLVASLDRHLSPHESRTQNGSPSVSSSGD
jgi:hypothetical protein